MIIEENKKTNDIVSDYYKCLAVYNNIRILLKENKYQIKPSDTEEQKQLKKEMKNEILVSLGRLGELALKYLLKIKMMYDYPNITYDEFIKQAYFKPRFVGIWGRTLGITESVIDSVKNAGMSTSQKPHDFNYLYTIISEFFPDLRNNMEKFSEIKKKSKNASAIIDKEESFEAGLDSQFIAFPLFTDEENPKLSLEQREIARLINTRNSTINDSGSMFVKFRYHSNELQDSSPYPNLKEVCELADDFIAFIRSVHLFKGDLTVPSEILYSLYAIKTNKLYVPYSEEEIKTIYEHPKLKNNADLIYDTLFYTDGWTFDEILEILNEPSINPEDYLTIFTYELKLSIIKYFRKFGLNDYEDMQKEISRNRSEKTLVELILKKQTISDYEDLRCQVCDDGSIENMKLVDILDVDGINILRKYPDTLKYFIENIAENCRQSKTHGGKLFELLLNNPILKENKEAWFGCDLAQLMIYNTILNSTKNDEVLYDTLNKEIGNGVLWLQNLRENIEAFKNNPQLLKKLPMFLNKDNNEKILRILINRGLDLKDIDNLDSTIFCYPIELVEIIISILDEFHIPLIVNNDINQDIYEIIKLITKKPVMKMEFRLYEGNNETFRNKLINIDSKTLCNIYTRVLNKYHKDDEFKLILGYTNE